MFEKLEHVGIAVKNVTQSVALFNALFQTEPYKSEIVESENVKTVFYQIGTTKIELLEATSPNSVIHKYIEKKGEGIHHLAFEVTNLENVMERLKSSGFTFINETPKDGADNKRIAFLHPKHTNGVLIELCQQKP